MPLPLIDSSIRPPVVHKQNYPSATIFHDAIRDYHVTSLREGFVEGPLSPEEAAKTIVSPLAAVPKKDSLTEMRIILDTSDTVNVYLQDFELHFPRVEDAINWIRCLGIHVHMAKVDLRKGFHQFPIHPDFTWMLGYSFEGKVYRYIRLPMGLNMAPYFFCRCTQALADALTERGIILLVYVDDFLIFGRSKLECQEALEICLAFFEELGVHVKHEKTVLPCQSLTYLGILIDIPSHTVSIPPDKLSEIRLAINSVFGLRALSYKKLASLIGKLSFAARCVQASRPFLRRMWNLIKTVKSGFRNSRIVLSNSFWLDLHWWNQFLESWNGVSFWSFHGSASSADITMYSDASATGFGVHFLDSSFYGHWNNRQISRSSQWRELKSISICLKALPSVFAHRSVWVYTDNQAVSYIIKNGG